MDSYLSERKRSQLPRTRQRGRLHRHRRTSRRRADMGTRRWAIPLERISLGARVQRPAGDLLVQGGFVSVQQLARFVDVQVLISFIFGSFYVNAALWADIEKFPRLIPRYGLLTRIALWRDSGGRFFSDSVKNQRFMWSPQ